MFWCHQNTQRFGVPHGHEHVLCELAKVEGDINVLDICIEQDIAWNAANQKEIVQNVE